MNTNIQKKMNAAFSKLFTNESIENAEKRNPELKGLAIRNLIYSLTHENGEGQMAIKRSKTTREPVYDRNSTISLFKGTLSWLHSYSIYQDISHPTVDIMKEMKKCGAELCVGLAKDKEDAKPEEYYMIIKFIINTEILLTYTCSCGCNTTTGKMSRTASKCGARYYNAEHQVANWKEHKKNCETCREYVKNKKI